MGPASGIVEPGLPRAEAARVYLVWSGWIALAFFSVYPTTNWLAAQRASTFQLYASWELSAPFVPQMIWAYLSMYILFLAPLFLLPLKRMPSLGRQLVAGTFVSGALFVLFPASLGFERILPAEPPYASIYATMFSVDHPHNLVPSLHLVFSSAIALACADAAAPLVRAALYGWLAVIVASTVLVHQHHLLDVAAAFLLVFFLRKQFKVSHA